jgi:hypothetical protein
MQRPGRNRSQVGDWLIFRPGLRYARDTPDGRRMCLSPWAACPLGVSHFQRAESSLPRKLGQSPVNAYAPSPDVVRGLWAPCGVIRGFRDISRALCVCVVRSYTPVTMPLRSIGYNAACCIPGQTAARGHGPSPGKETGRDSRVRQGVRSCERDSLVPCCCLLSVLA